MSGEQFISPEKKAESTGNDDFKKGLVFPFVYLLSLLSSISFIRSVLGKSKYAYDWRSWHATANTLLITVRYSALHDSYLHPYKGYNDLVNRSFLKSEDLANNHLQVLVGGWLRWRIKSHD